MQKIFTYHFDWSLVTIAFFSLIVSFFVFVNILQANTGDSGGLTETWMEMNGWAWSPNIGWLSLNCYNDFDSDNQLTAADNKCLTVRNGHPGLGSVDYGLKIDTSAGPDRDKRAIGGCAWAGNVGWWICFDDPGTTQAPQYGVYLNGPSGVQYYNTALPSPVPSPANTFVQNSLFHGATYQTESSNGHASILPLEGVAGWSNELGFPIVSTSTTGTLEGCFNCSETIRKCNLGFNDDCVDDAICQANDPSSTCEPTCANCLQYNYDTSDPPVMQSVIAGYNCSGCTLQNIDNICPENSYSHNDNTCTHCFDPSPAVHYYSTPGLIADYTTSTNDGYGSMCGWAWNQDSVSDNGVGWLQFSPSITATNNPYFQVNSGDIYAKGEIKNRNILGSNISNAFIIETNSNVVPFNIYASSTLSRHWSKNRPLINFPAENITTGKYTNVLGSLDYKGLITEVGTSGKNKYGSSIDDDTDSANWTILKNGMIADALLLNNRVYEATSDIDLAQNAGIVFTDGTGEESGSGVIIIQGDVTINNNIKYEASMPDKLKNIASPVFIINGNLTIGSGVSQLAGTFIVFGDFNTSVGGSQLVVNGSVLSKKFILARTYSSGPSELFINDGRLKVNPPAGLQNFSANLPKFTYQ